MSSRMIPIATSFSQELLRHSQGISSSSPQALTWSTPFPSFPQSSRFLHFNAKCLYDQCGRECRQSNNHHIANVYYLIMRGTNRMSHRTVSSITSNRAASVWCRGQMITSRYSTTSSSTARLQWCTSAASQALLVQLSPAFSLCISSDLFTHRSRTWW